MSNFEGLDEEMQQEDTLRKNSITDFEDAKKKRKPFHYWTVSGTDHKMKLTTDMITMLENKYRMNILKLVTANDMPPLSVMLTVAQAAINPWEHGTKYEKVKDMYDAWLEEGGNQTDFYAKVIIPTLAVSGFFTADQAEMILKNIEEMDTLM